MAKRAATTAPRSTALKGRIEKFRGRQLMGWAMDPEDPARPIELKVYVDGAIVARSQADIRRKDLLERGIGTGDHGFLVPLPIRLFDGASHTVEVREGDTVLRGSGPLDFKADRRAAAAARRARKARRDVPAVPDPAPAEDDPYPRIPGMPKTAFALLGRDDWLFLCNDSNRTLAQLSGARRFSDDELERYADVFAARRDRFAEMGIPYVFAAAPTKESICRELLPPVPVSDLGLPLDQIVGRLRTIPGCDILDLRSAVRDAAASVQPYLRTDTHWTPQAGHFAYFALMKELAKRLPGLSPLAADSFEWKSYPGYRGDLADKPKLLYLDGRFVAADPHQFSPDRFTETVLRVDPRSAGFTRQETPPDYEISSTRETVIVEKPDSNLPRAVVMRDSFAIECMPFLGESFSRIVYLWDPNPHYELIAREEPDIVIQMMVERFLIRVPELPAAPPQP